MSYEFMHKVYYFKIIFMLFVYIYFYILDISIDVDISFSSGNNRKLVCVNCEVKYQSSRCSCVYKNSYRSRT